MLALALVLNALKLYQFPNGGSIDLAMIPDILLCPALGLRLGPAGGLPVRPAADVHRRRRGLGLAVAAAGLSGGLHALGLAGLFRGRGKLIYAGILLGCVARFIVHFISGVTIYAINAPTQILNMTLTSPWLFSLVYNGSYMLVDTDHLCLVVF
jgi:thiamine transporter